METGKLSQVGPKNFFAHVNRNKRMGTRIQHLFHPDGSPATTDQEMADLLKQTFQSFYRTDKGSTPTFHPRTAIRMASPHITESETQSALEALKPNKGAGSDGFFPKALKTLSPYIAPTLSRILTSPSKPPRSLITGATPLLPQWQKHPAQQTQTYSGPLV